MIFSRNEVYYHVFVWFDRLNLIFCRTCGVKLLSLKEKRGNKRNDEGAPHNKSYERTITSAAVIRYAKGGGQTNVQQHLNGSQRGIGPVVLIVKMVDGLNISWNKI